jgi:hypothetical protein
MRYRVRSRDLYELFTCIATVQSVIDDLNERVEALQELAGSG